MPCAKLSRSSTEHPASSGLPLPSRRHAYRAAPGRAPHRPRRYRSARRRQGPRRISTTARHHPLSHRFERWWSAGTSLDRTTFQLPLLPKRQSPGAPRDDARTGMEVIGAQRVSNSVAGCLRARLRTRSSDFENHRPTFDGQRVVWLSQALGEPVSFSVVSRLPESDASRPAAPAWPQHRAPEPVGQRSLGRRAGPAARSYRGPPR